MNPTVKKHLQAGELVKAIECLDIPDGSSALQESEFLRWLGVILERGLANTEALREFRAAVAADPGAVAPRQNLVNLLVRETYFTEAKEEILGWIATDPRGFSKYPLLFKIFKELGLKDELEPVLKLLKENQSRKSIYYTEVAKYYISEGRLNEAADLVNEYLATGRREAVILELKDTIESKIRNA